MALPWWVRWVAVPALALLVLGGLIMSLLGWLVGLAFRVLVLATLVAILIFVVRKVTAAFSGDSSGSAGGSAGGGW